MRVLTVEEVFEVHAIGIKDHGGGDPRVPQAAAGAVGSVLHTATYHEGPLGYAAAILCYIARAQHFTDGNKRTAWGGCVRALELNGYTLDVETEQAASFVLKIVNENMDPAEVADQLAEWLVELPPRG